MAEYWLISAPGDKTCQQTWETMNNVTSKQNNLCVNYKFHIPDLKVSFLHYFVVFSLFKNLGNHFILVLLTQLLIEDAFSPAKH